MFAITPVHPLSESTVPAAQAAPVALAFTDVSLVYPTRTGPIRALGDITAHVAAGEFVSLLGPSGCGKSTLLKLAAGLLPATSGSVALQGVEVVAPRKDVGIVFQRPLLLPWKTVRENVLLPLRATGRAGPDAHEKCAAMLDLVGLASFELNYPSELSGGMQQRVALARMLIHDPSILLMDEPFAALDAMTRETLSLELQRIWMRHAKSVLFITHSIQEAVFLSDRVLVMSARPGQIIESFDIDLPRPRTLETLASAPFAAACDHLRRHFVRQPE